PSGALFDHVLTTFQRESTQRIFNPCVGGQSLEARSLIAGGSGCCSGVLHCIDSSSHCQAARHRPCQPTPRHASVSYAVSLGLGAGPHTWSVSGALPLEL